MILASSCSYDNKGDDAQREANRVYEESLAKCNEIKGRYTGTLESPLSNISMSANIYCEISSQSQTDKNNTTTFQVVPEIYLYRDDLPIPSVLQILDQGSGIGMRSKSKGGVSIPGESNGSGASGNGTGLPEGMTAPAGSLLGSVRFEPFTGFQGMRSGSSIVGEIRTSQPVGKLTLNKQSNVPEMNELLSLNEKVENKLVEALSKYMGPYHGCLFLEPNESGRLPVKISVTLSLNDGVFQGKTMKVLRARFFRDDLPGNPALANLWMRVGLSWTTTNYKQILSITLESTSSAQNVNYAPILNSTLIASIDKEKTDPVDWFYGTFESKQEIGKFRLFKQNSPVRDCRIYKNSLEP
jgi:hypothetical protein